MLCPNVIDLSDELSCSWSTILQVDALAYASMNTLIGTLSPDPSWLSQIRTRLSLLSDAGAQWQKTRAAIWAETLSPFNSYYALFSGFTAASSDLGDDAETWVQLLQELSTQLTSAADKAKQAEQDFSDQIDNLQNVEKLLSDSLDEAWQQLSSEEQIMIDLAAQIGSLQDQLDNLQDNLGSSELKSESSYIKSSVSITYSVVSSAGDSIPYLSIASLLYTIGNLAYDLIVADQEISSTISKIVSLRNEASKEAQAAAMTKAIIQMINRFDKQLVAIQAQLPAFSAMWEAEQQKVEQVIDALNAGAQPSLVTSLVSMEAAEATWQQLSDFVTRIAMAPESGGSVTIITSDSNPIQKSE